MDQPFTYQTLKAHLKKGLLQAKKTKLVMQVSIIGIPDCDKCKNEFPLVSLEAELKNQRLPFKDCPRIKDGLYQVCAAVYGCQVVRNEDGLPIRVKAKERKPRQPKPPNLNTQYGRRKWREQGREEYNKMSKEEKLNANIKGIIILAIILIVVWLILGTDGFLKWMHR